MPGDIFTKIFLSIEMLITIPIKIGIINYFEQKYFPNTCFNSYRIWLCVLNKLIKVLQKCTIETNNYNRSQITLSFTVSYPEQYCWICRKVYIEKNLKIDSILIALLPCGCHLHYYWTQFVPPTIFPSITLSLYLQKHSEICNDFSL